MIGAEHFLFGNLTSDADTLTHHVIQYIKERPGIIGAASVFVSDDGKIEDSRWAVDLEKAMFGKCDNDRLLRSVETAEDACYVLNTSVIHEVAHCQTIIQHPDDGFLWNRFLFKAKVVLHEE